MPKSFYDSLINTPMVRVFNYKKIIKPDFNNYCSTSRKIHLLYLLLMVLTLLGTAGALVLLGIVHDRYYVLIGVILILGIINQFVISRTIYIVQIANILNKVDGKDEILISKIERPAFWKEQDIIKIINLLIDTKNLSRYYISEDKTRVINGISKDEII